MSSCLPADCLDDATGKWVRLWEVVFTKQNLHVAKMRVRANRGAPGVDGVTVYQLDDFLVANWERISCQLESGTYRPQPVRMVNIPKPDGGQRMLGIACVVDRVICQAIAQVLTPIFDLGFVPVSYGFRPNKSAHDAARVARLLLDQGYEWVVEVDLSKYFDTVNHDMLMARVARRVDDKRLLKLIRAYLNAGIMDGGLVHFSDKGTPQGSPLSPLLSNIMLDDFDQWMWGKRTRFIRYADDIRVFVRSERAAQRALDVCSRFLEQKLKLKVNQEKSTIRHGMNAELLGFAFYKTKSGYKFRLAPRSKRRLKQKVKELTGRSQAVSIEERIGRINRYFAGWLGYFFITDCRSFLLEVDAHLRRRLRMCVWKDWKKTKTKIRNLRSLGVLEHQAYMWGNSSKSYWRIAGSHVLSTTLDNEYWAQRGLRSFAEAWSSKRGFAY